MGAPSPFTSLAAATAHITRRSRRFADSKIRPWQKRRYFEREKERAVPTTAAEDRVGGPGEGGARAGFDMDDPPTTWESQASPVQLFTVERDSAEFAMVRALFHASLKREVNGIVNIAKLERVQNRPLWEEVSIRLRLLLQLRLRL